MAIDTRLTLGGESLETAWANMYNAVSVGAPVSSQPFFEAALGGANSAYCAGFSSCAAAVASKLKSNVAAGQVYTVFRNLEGQASWTPGRTLINSLLGTQATSVFLNLSDGWGNYNAGFVTFTARGFHGFTAGSNFTWSKALGTGTLPQSSSAFSVVDPFNLGAMYGPLRVDAKFPYNSMVVYDPPFLASGKGVLRQVRVGVVDRAAVHGANGFSVASVGGIGGECELPNFRRDELQFGIDQ